MYVTRIDSSLDGSEEVFGCGLLSFTILNKPFSIPKAGDYRNMKRYYYYCSRILPFLAAVPDLYIAYDDPRLETVVSANN